MILYMYTHVIVAMNKTNKTQEASTVDCLKADVGLKNTKMREYFQYVLFCVFLILQSYSTFQNIKCKLKIMP